MKINPGDLHFVWSRSAERIKCFRSDGSPIGPVAGWRIGNHVANGHEPFPDGDWEMLRSVPVRVDFGPYGKRYIPMRDGEPARRGCYLHAGRKGPESITEGCGRLYQRDLDAVAALSDAAIKGGHRSWLTVQP